jgi:hypothetical protein
MLKLCAGQLMAVLIATLLLDVADMPPLTVDEARIKDDTILKPTISNLFLAELGTRGLVRTFRKRIIRERDNEDHMTSMTMELLAKAANGFGSL